MNWALKLQKMKNLNKQLEDAKLSISRILENSKSYWVNCHQESKPKHKESNLSYIYF